MEELEFFCNGLEDAGIEFSERTTYSGRGMYGMVCLGFVTNTPMRLVSLLDTIDNSIFFSSYAHTDSMGLSSIVYWPGLTIDMPIEVPVDVTVK